MVILMPYYSELMINNALIRFVYGQAYVFGLDKLEPGRSRFSKRVYFVGSHLKIYRDILLFAFENIIYSSRDLSNPEILDGLYYNRGVTESPLSRQLRYKILEENYKALPGRV